MEDVIMQNYVGYTNHILNTGTITRPMNINNERKERETFKLIAMPYFESEFYC
jgi:hypothetical protein